MNPVRISLITGAAGGIGLACAKTLAARGDRVVLLDRNEEVHTLAATMRSEGHQADAYVVDLSDLHQIEEGADAILKEIGGVDILVNNAGIHPKVNGRIQGFEEITPQEWEAVFRVNVTAPFLLSQRFIGPMKQKKWGRIVNVGSRAGRTYSNRAGTHYASSKAAIVGMTRKLAGDYAAFGITANCVAPGQIMTPLAKRFAPEVLAEAMRTIPVQRFGSAEEVAGAVAYFSSDIAAFVSGTVLDLNGAETMV